MAQVIRTNNQPRDVLGWYDLTDAERADFDYRAEGEGSYVRYRGAAYDLGEFMLAPDDLKPWNGMHTDTAFSAVLIRFVEDGERVVMGFVYA